MSGPAGRRLWLSLFLRAACSCDMLLALWAGKCEFRLRRGEAIRLLDAQQLIPILAGIPRRSLTFGGVMYGCMMGS